MTTTHTTLLDEARGLLDDTVALRRRIHRHPEIGLTLPRTQQTVLEALDGLGLKTRTGQKTTSVVATLDGGRPAGPDDAAARRHGRPALEGRHGPVLRLRGRRGDARLRSRQHVAMLVGAARMLAAGGPTCPAASCSCSSPARRAITAPKVVIEEGLLEGSKPDAAFGLHVGARHPAGVIATRGAPDARLRRHVSASSCAVTAVTPPHPRRPRPDPDRLRDRPGVPDAGHAPRERLRSRRRHGGEDRGRHHEQYVV